MSYVEHCNQHGQYHGDYCGGCVEATQIELENFRNIVMVMKANLALAQERVYTLEEMVEQEDVNSWRLDYLEKENARLREALERILGMHSHSPRCFLGHNGWECCFDMHYEQIAREALKGN